MKRAVILSTAVALLMILVLVTVAIVNQMPAKSPSVQPFYVGVTFSGDSVTDAKLLIDKVKDYTNLFVMQSGFLMYDLNATEEICDYAVDAGLSIILSFTHNSRGSLDKILDVAQTRWGNHFLGIYYNDEPGGKMLDKEGSLYDPITQGFIHKMQDKSLQYGTINDTTVIRAIYSMSEAITITTEPETGPANYLPRVVDSPVDSIGDLVSPTEDSVPSATTVYYPNGTICHTTTDASRMDRTLTYHPDGRVQDETGQPVSDQGNISRFQTYQEIYNTLPIQTYSDAAHLYIINQQESLSVFDGASSIRLFTSDYALYWWDYQVGYDVVFAQLGWNNSVVQEVGLVRGAASLQGKSWGTIITWTYTHPPYLIGGEEMYSQMCASYEAGAEYVVV
ncbi:MAG: hypothetical protein LBI79_00780, partial [Nitrososphaerota archaeon]|nr:hypothetical protein [Nitrososphaerota archaeon]